MKALRAGLILAALLIPAVLLLATGLVHLRDGIAVEAAFPIPLYMAADYSQPIGRYRKAAEALKNTDPQNGNARVSFAEAMFYGGEPPHDVWPAAVEGLSHAPAFAQGWAFYAEAELSNDRRVASRALEQAFTIAPFDYFWAGRRAQIAARLWDVLDAGTRQDALRQARLLWATPTLRDQILSLLMTDAGARLLGRAYGDDPETLRAINRWVAQRRRDLLARQHT